MATGEKQRHRRGRPRRHRRSDGQSADRRGRGLCGQLSAERMDAARPRRVVPISTSSKQAEGRVQRRPRAPTPTTSGSSSSTRSPRRQRLALRPQGEDADQALHHPARARRRAARRMHPVEIKSRDGLTLVSLPDAAAGQRPGRRRRARRSRVPLVLLVHGGPWGRDG